MIKIKKGGIILAGIQQILAGIKSIPARIQDKGTGFCRLLGLRRYRQKAFLMSASVSSVSSSGEAFDCSASRLA